MTLQSLPLKKIFEGNNPRKGFDEKSIDELAASIKQHGVIQPIMVRPLNDHMYDIVCGERRWRAAKLAGLEEIPANIRELTDDEAFEIAITENLQREGVHPLDEAVAYKTYQDQKKVSIEELAAKFAKGKEYIAQRLSFNNLLPELKKDFHAGVLLVGHAVLLARLQPADQKDIMASCKNHHHKEGTWYDPIDDMKDAIENQVMHELSHAGFDKKDSKLVPKAGPCILCPKRSGAGLLFADVKEKDRCFDGACFKLKMKAHLLRQIDELVASPNPMPAVMGSNSKEIDPEVKKKLTDNKVKLLQEYTDYMEAPKSDKGSTMALKVCGTGAGKIVGIRLKATDKAKAAKIAAGPGEKEKLTADDIDQLISGIKDRAKRALELDGEKVHKRITDQLTGLKPFLQIDMERSTISPSEESAALYLLYQMLDSNDRVIVAKALNIKVEKSYGNSLRVADELGLAKALIKAPKEIFSFITRGAIKEKMIGNSILASGPYGHLVRSVAEGYPGVPIADYENDQQASAKKRIENSNKRIEELQKQKSELAPKKAKPARKGASAPKDSIRKGIKALLKETEEDPEDDE